MTSSTKCVCTNKGYMRSDMEEIDRMAMERKKYVVSPEEGRCYRDQSKVV